MDSAEKQLEKLLDFILDSSEDDAQRQEFAALMEQHPELANTFIEQLRVHSMLQWKCDEVNLPKVNVPGEFATRVGSDDATGSPARRKMVQWMASIAVILAVAAGTVFWAIQSRIDPERAVAEIVDDHDVVWSDRTALKQHGRLIHPGRLEIESGVLTLRFRSGVTVTVRDAASMRIESAMLVKLDRGQATAQVPHWAKGFTIETADVEVIDLGTEFGVVARGDGMTDVVIFEGQVDVKPTGGSGRLLKRLNQGEAARVNSSGAIDRIVEVRGDVKGGWSTSDQFDSTRNVFRAIRDNIPPSDGNTYYYYQISTGGLRDDAWAYVDGHPHQWNGLTTSGLPEFLRGADYARTFNDYRYIPDFEIVVEMSRPADLFVFFDDRVPIPDWLLGRFEDTGVDIGLDEGPWEGIPDHRTAVGSGKSIDNVFSVWRRRCEIGELVTLGAVGDSKEARAMYGIAAKPIESERTTDLPY